MYHLACGRLYVLRVWEKALLGVAMYPEKRRCAAFPGGPVIINQSTLTAWNQLAKVILPGHEQKRPISLTCIFWNLCAICAADQMISGDGARHAIQVWDSKEHQDPRGRTQKALQRVSVGYPCPPCPLPYPEAFQAPRMAPSALGSMWCERPWTVSSLPVMPE